MTAKTHYRKTVGSGSLYFIQHSAFSILHYFFFGSFFSTMAVLLGR